MSTITEVIGERVKEDLIYSAIIYSHLLLRSLLGGGMPAIFIQEKDGCLKLTVETRHKENTKASVNAWK